MDEYRDYLRDLLFDCIIYANDLAYMLEYLRVEYEDRDSFYDGIGRDEQDIRDNGRYEII